MAAAEHWDFVYASNTDDQLSWFQDEPTTSLRLLFAAAGQDAAVIDVGAGTSRLAAALLEAGWSDLTVLDVSAEALAAAHGNDGDPRLGAVIADVRTWQPERAWTLWHDRAVFHFLVAPGDRARYIAAATRAVTVRPRRPNSMFRTAHCPLRPGNAC
jgi:trans-aconitate methyltransferase